MKYEYRMNPGHNGSDKKYSIREWLDRYGLRPCWQARDVVVLKDLNFCAVSALSSVLEGLACFVMVMRAVCMHRVQPNQWCLLLPSTLYLLYVVLTVLPLSFSKMNSTSNHVLVHSEFYSALISCFS